MTPPSQVPFRAHRELLTFFLTHRAEIVERLQGVLNAQRQPIEYLQDRARLFRDVEDCFFTGLTHSQAALRGQLEEAHWEDGFKPRDIPGLHNGLIDPAEMMIRAFYLWQQTRWPGRSGRVRYAHTLFNLYVIRCLGLLTMRLWDDGAGSAGERLSWIQGVLDELWRTATADQPAFVRDARWLIQLAQSPATDDLGAYFDVAKNVAASFAEEDRIEIHKAGVRMTAGHLRSQMRYYAMKKAVPLSDASVLLITRTSNALDFALLIQELVPLLESYERSLHGAGGQRRRELADAICQGISPDPELFVKHIDLLGAYSMIEHLFVTVDRGGHAAYSPMGMRHVQLLQEYEARIARVSGPLHDDCLNFRPVAGGYSPYGVLYGFSTDLIEHMALKTAQPDAAARFGLEDVFTGGDASSGKLAWVNGWRKLPHLKPDVAKQFDYPQQFAEDIFNRVEETLRARVSGAAASTVGRLFIIPADDLPAESEGSIVPDLPARYIGSSDALSDRREGRCIVSYKTPDGWVAISKDVLTEVLAAGHDAKVALPPEAAGVLQLMCPNLVVLPEERSVSAGGQEDDAW
jgi:hypothetical protein